MRLLRIAAAMCLLAVAACAPAGCTTTGGTPIISQTLDEKALYVVELAYAGGLASVEAAVDAGAITGEDAVTAGAILDQTNSAIVVAREAYAAGNTVGAINAINDAYRALASLRGLTSPATLPG